jgi:hypothetical protein
MFLRRLIKATRQQGNKATRQQGKKSKAYTALDFLRAAIYGEF